MLHPFWLISKMKDFKCGNCRRYPHSVVRIHGQAILPARGERITLRVDYECRFCNRIASVLVQLPNDEFAKLLIDAVRRGGFRTTFRDPIPVAVFSPVSPSVVNGTPSEPIGADEIAQAAEILKQTSFRRDSKTWKQFMDRIERGY